MKSIFFLLLGSVFAAGGYATDVLPVFNVWAQPQRWPQHLQLRGEFLQALRCGDLKKMEEASRAGVALMEDDPTWRYNHACALAYREDGREAALDELERAIQLGFRDANAIEKDHDFARISGLKRFKELVRRAEKLKGAPIPGRPATGPAALHYGGTVTLNASNVTFNLDIGLFETALAFAGENNPAPLAGRYGQSRPKPAECPERTFLAPWLSEGTASGNGGDIYINRDRNHSPLAVGDFPLLSAIRYPAEAQKCDLDVDLPNLIFAGNPPVFGNASRARVSSPFWRSLARAAITDPYAARHMNDLYLNNQLWFFPAHKDFGQEGIGDVFPALTPHMVISRGSSFTDQPFLRAVVAASAAFPRPTKQALVRRHLVAPTLQALLRRTLKTVGSEKAYLTAAAHPVAFEQKDLDIVRLVKAAHDMRPEHIPPAVILAPVNSRLFPIAMPEPIRDYPDPSGEVLFVTPTAAAFVLRGLEAERTFIFQAQTYPERDPSARYAWRVIRGDPKAVRISAPLGETLAAPDTGLAQITIDRRALTSRLEIAVFARSQDTAFGAPSIISFLPIAFEKRVYDEKKRLVSIDNANTEGVYVDPFVALPRPWKDTFKYDREGKLLGYVRTVGTLEVAAFTATGARIVSRKADGTPEKIVKVRYMPCANRSGSSVNMPPTLTYADEGEPFACP